MKMEKSFVGIFLIAVGLILSIVGMVAFTGIADWGIPSAVMYLGYAVTVLGLVLVFIDIRENADLIGDYYEEKDTKEAINSTPDDDYLVDLSHQEKKDPFTLFGTEEGEDEPKVYDMTKKR